MSWQTAIEQKALSAYKNSQNWQVGYQNTIDTLTEFVGRRGDKITLITEELQILWNAYDWYMKNYPMDENTAHDVVYWLFGEWEDCERELAKRGIVLPD